MSADVIQYSFLNVLPSTNPSSSGVGAVDLFVHNEGGGIMTYVGGVLFAIPPIIGLL